MNVRLVLIALFFYGSTALAQQAPDPCATAPQSCATLIETHATSEMRIANTAVDVSVDVNASGRDLPEVQHNLAEKSNTLLAYLKAQQVERLITTRVTFAPDTKSQKSGPDKTVGYDGGAQISFRAKPDKVADLLAGVLTSGANEIESTTFTPTEQEIADARVHLSEDATKTAVAQADAIAKAAGMRVVSIRNISVDSDNLSAYTHIAPGVQELYDSNGGPPARPLPVDAASGDSQLSIRVNVTSAAMR